MKEEGVLWGRGRKDGEVEKACLLVHLIGKRTQKIFILLTEQLDFYINSTENCNDIFILTAHKTATIHYFINMINCNVHTMPHI